MVTSTMRRVGSRTRLVGSIAAVALAACDAPGTVARGLVIRDSSDVTIVDVGDPASLELPEWDVADTPPS